MMKSIANGKRHFMALFWGLIFLCHSEAAEIVPGVFVPAGIVGDGATDNTKALQAALDADRGPIYLPAGRYLLKESLRIPSHSGIIGTGTLYMDADQPVLTGDASEAELKDILIDGVKIEKKWISQSEQEAIVIRKATNIRLSKLDVTGVCSVAVVYLENCQRFSISDCYIHDCLLDVDYRPRPSGRGVDLLGICVAQCSFGQITGNRIENLQATRSSLKKIDCQTDGINPSRSSNLVIANNMIRNVGEGIDLINCESCTVTGNVIQDCYHFGIKVIHGSRLNTVANNSIRGASLAGMSLYFGQTSLGPNYGNVVSGNVIANVGSFPNGEWKGGWQRAGIEIVNDSKPDNSVHRYLVTGNMIYDNQEEPTCRFGVIERYINWDEQGESHSLEQPRDDGQLFTNLIRNNYIHGVTVAKYQTGSVTDE